jgi:hypothetical protein
MQFSQRKQQLVGMVAEATCSVFEVYKGKANGKSTPIQTRAGP